MVILTMASIPYSTTSGHTKSLFHDPDHYIKAFEAFSKASAKYQVLYKWVETVFTDAVVDKLEVNIPEGEDFKVLGIGTGAGEMDSKMILALLKRFLRINNCVVEPAEGPTTRYQELVTKIADELKGVTYDWRLQGLDQFRKSREESGETSKFHFISAVHSLYYADDPEDSLQWLFDQVEDGGMLMIITSSVDSGWGQLHNRFSHLEDSLMHYISSRNIRDAFAKRKISFKNYKQPSCLDITNCFEEGNKDGDLKIDFLSHVVHFRETASSDLRKDFMEYLGGLCSERKDGEVSLTNDWDAVIATK